ncbi:hypothetical protein [Aeromicrobium sp. UC242_57]|uniref:hypothetical protein n=1 Tax=Aeromicrobium sp. UC242_57 TaxID=3374624 RepID=UPI0037AC1698
MTKHPRWTTESHYAAGMHLALVVNPTSGKKRGELIAAQAADRLRGAGHRTTTIQGEDAPAARDQLSWRSIRDSTACSWSAETVPCTASSTTWPTPTSSSG